MKYIDAEKLIAKLTKMQFDLNAAYRHPQSDSIAKAISLEYDDVISLVTSLQQKQPDDKLTNIAYWLEYFGMPKENIENCITQISQGYGAIRYLEGVQHGAEAVNELAQQEQPEVGLEKEYKRFINCDNGRSMYDCARHFYELGLNTKKEETK